jgi:hypothetical protein
MPQPNGGHYRSNITAVVVIVLLAYTVGLGFVFLYFRQHLMEDLREVICVAEVARALTHKSLSGLSLPIPEKVLPYIVP